MLGFIGSRWGVLGGIPGFFQLILGSLKNDNPNNITGIDKIHLKCNVIDRSIVHSFLEAIL